MLLDDLMDTDYILGMFYSMVFYNKSSVFKAFLLISDRLFFDIQPVLVQHLYSCCT